MLVACNIPDTGWRCSRALYLSVCLTEVYIRDKFQCRDKIVYFRAYFFLSESRLRGLQKRNNSVADIQKCNGKKCSETLGNLQLFCLKCIMAQQTQVRRPKDVVYNKSQQDA